MPRLKITIEYSGTGKVGWQHQENGISIQRVIEDAVFIVTREKVVIYGAGRTDSGVHAFGQVAHFDLLQNINFNKLTSSLNFFLSKYNIGIINCCEVAPNFHARFSAIARHYEYRIINRQNALVLEKGRAWWIRSPLNIEKMIEAAAMLEGQHDFSSFRNNACQAKSPLKHLTKIDIVQMGDLIRIYFSAPSFLYNMVRNIVGTLVEIGRNKYPSEYIKFILAQKDRKFAGPTAYACGLFFLRVDY